MSFKDVLAMMLTASDDHVVALAEAVAAKQAGKASALLFEVQPEPIYDGEGRGSGTAAIWAELMEKAHAEFLEQKARAQALLADRMAVRWVSVPEGSLDKRAAVEARYADLAVLPRPRGKETAEDLLLEGALFGSGRPVMLSPPDWRAEAIGDVVAIAWNAKREAVRAVAAAAPLLDNAKKVVVLTIDAKPSTYGHGDAPGVDIAAHLSRRGLPVEVRNVDGLGRKHGAALVEECRYVGADLLVLGGYGHSRLQEYVLGGVTRELIHAASIPLFMAH